MSHRVLSILIAIVLTAGNLPAEQPPLASGPVSAAIPGADELVIDIEHGHPSRVIDGVGWVLGVPKKVMLWDHRVDNHQVSNDTVAEAASFLAENEVNGVKVRVNQYDPLGEWRRLAKNDRVGLGWRATVGAVYTLGYSLVPGRLIGGDWYNPYTDTVHVYSDVPALAMEQAAQAADNHERTHPGLYSAVRLLPFVGLVHETRSKQAVFDYVDETGSPEERAEARRVLHPQMGAEIGGQATVFLPQVDPLMQLGGAAIGHAFGRYQAAQIENESSEAPSAEGPSIIIGGVGPGE